jgi:hypothetical protein
LSLHPTNGCRCQRSRCDRGVPARPFTDHAPLESLRCPLTDAIPRGFTIPPAAVCVIAFVRRPTLSASLLWRRSNGRGSGRAGHLGPSPERSDRLCIRNWSIPAAALCAPVSAISKAEPPAPRAPGSSPAQASGPLAYWPSGLQARGGKRQSRILRRHCSSPALADIIGAGREATAAIASSTPMPELRDSGTPSPRCDARAAAAGSVAPLFLGRVQQRVDG